MEITQYGTLHTWAALSNSIILIHNALLVVFAGFGYVAGLPGCRKWLTSSSDVVFASTAARPIDYAIESAFRAPSDLYESLYI